MGELKNRTCQNCGATISVKAKFCPKCGSKIDAAFSDSEEKETAKLDLNKLEEHANSEVDETINSGESVKSDLNKPEEHLNNKIKKSTNNTKTKKRWWYSALFILILGFLGVASLPLLLVAIILFILRVKNKQGRKITNIIVGILLAIFFLAYL